MPDSKKVTIVQIGFSDLSRYSLPKQEEIVGCYNTKPDQHNCFRPKIADKPIVLALGGNRDDPRPALLLIDMHTGGNQVPGLYGKEIFQSKDFIIDCQRNRTTRESFWAITIQQETFVYSSEKFMGMWNLSDVDLLCSFIAGETSIEELRAQSTFIEKAVNKAEARYTALKEVSSGIIDSQQRLTNINRRYDYLIKETAVILNFLPKLIKISILKYLQR